ncbi:ABC transporter ATP-binding protein [Tamlana fucoidanivorans]|uniref:ABC transporter ATP-binding protein n=1 Tax=Allotamlana fucoidanivorans TaxID=2583814 RepID=A0A5C4SGN7_9FLAO|nr:ABC transporter ATP-binding protein [Tamlana fucoidanivorans]TNJ42848.1 ABC transporter ATP-binding protein [Tamlana fucoidanivorans]
MTLEIDNIELYFKEKSILNGIYIKGETGKITGILGSNGCGKSCLMNIIFGSLKPKYKLVRINNKPIVKALYKTNLVSYLPQHHFIPKTYKLSTVFNLFNVNWYDFIAYFKDFKERKNTRFNHLSGGEQRLVEIFIVLKSDRRIILLDEPFSHLSPLYVETIKAIIQVEKHRKAIIITDHMYEHIIAISENIYLLKNGHSKLVTDLKLLETYQYLSHSSLSNIVKKEV